MNYWNLNYSIYWFGNFNISTLNWNFSDLINYFEVSFINRDFFNYFNFLNYLLSCNNLYNLLNNFWYCYNSLYYFFNDYYFLDITDHFNWLLYNKILNSLILYIFSNRHNFLNNFLNLYNLWNLLYNSHYFFHDFRNLNNLLYNPLNRNNFLLY